MHVIEFDLAYSANREGLSKPVVALRLSTFLSNDTNIFVIITAISECRTSIADTVFDDMNTC